MNLLVRFVVTLLVKLLVMLLVKHLVTILVSLLVKLLVTLLVKLLVKRGVEHGVERALPPLSLRRRLSSHAHNSNNMNHGTLTLSDYYELRAPNFEIDCYMFMIIRGGINLPDGYYPDRVFIVPNFPAIQGLGLYENGRVLIIGTPVYFTQKTLRKRARDFLNGFLPDTAEEEFENVSETESEEEPESDYGSVYASDNVSEYGIDIWGDKEYQEDYYY